MLCSWQTMPMFPIWQCTGIIDRMSYRKWRETKQQLRWWPDLSLLGCCLVSLHFLCNILSSRPFNEEQRKVAHVKNKDVRGHACFPRHGCYPSPKMWRFMHNSAPTFRERDSGSQDWDSAEKKTGIIVTSLTLAVWCHQRACCLKCAFCLPATGNTALVNPSNTGCQISQTWVISKGNMHAA